MPSPSERFKYQNDHSTPAWLASNLRTLISLMGRLAAVTYSKFISGQEYFFVAKISSLANFLLMLRFIWQGHYRRSETVYSYGTTVLLLLHSRLHFVLLI